MHHSTVLLVEDEPLIALDLKWVLENSGYRVLSASDAQDAIKLSLQCPPDLAILNFHYQHFQNGMDLALLLRAIQKIKVLFITGARPQDLEASKYYRSDLSVLHKPFTRRQLRSFLFPEKFPPFPESQGTFTE